MKYVHIYTHMPCFGVPGPQPVCFGVPGPYLKGFYTKKVVFIQKKRFLYKNIQEYPIISNNIQEYTGIYSKRIFLYYLDILGYSWIFWDILGYSWIFLDIIGYIPIRGALLNLDFIEQDTMRFVLWALGS